MHLRLIIFVLLSLNSAKAEFKYSACPNINTPAFAQVLLEDGVLCNTLEEIQQVYDDIKIFAGTAPAQTLFVQQKSYASFGTYGQLIVLNQQQQAWGGVRPQIQNEMIWAHEIGHIFFSNWLTRDFKPIQGFRDYMIASGEIQLKQRDPHFDTFKELKSKWQADFSKARDIQVPYNELFADLVGVLYADDALAMTEAMEAPGMPETERIKMKYYAFAGKYSLSNWNETEVHYFFAPARAYIGEHLLKFPMSSSRKSEVLQKVYRACLTEVQKYWNLSKTYPSPKQANESLIQTLKMTEK